MFNFEKHSAASIPDSVVIVIVILISHTTSVDLIWPNDGLILDGKMGDFSACLSHPISFF